MARPADPDVGAPDRAPDVPALVARDAGVRGNRERPWRLFDRDGLLRYLRRTGRANAEKYAAAFAEFGAAGAETLRFGSTAEAVAWAKGLRLSR